MADTVQELLDMLNMKLHGFKYSLSQGDADKIRALNVAKHKVWQHLLASGRVNNGSGNWWITETDLALNGVRDVTLPNDCHDVAFVECSTGGWEGVQFKAADLIKQVYQEQRRQPGTVGPESRERYFIVTGPRPPKFRLDRVPNVAISLHVLYTGVIPEWTALTDSIAMIPTPYREAIANYACGMLVASDQDPAIAQLWLGIWGEDKALMSATGHDRQIADVVRPELYDKSG